MKKYYLLLMLLPCFVAVQVQAQGLYLGPQAGFQKANDADQANFLVGAALRLKLSDLLGAEGSINYRQEDFDNGALTVRSWPVMVTGLIYPLPIIYAAIGGGWYNTTFDFNSDLIKNETKQKFGWHFGAGMELPFGKSKITGDIRYVFIDYDLKDITKNTPFADVTANFYVITVGLLFGL